MAENGRNTGNKRDNIAVASLVVAILSMLIAFSGYTVKDYMDSTQTITSTESEVPVDASSAEPDSIPDTDSPIEEPAEVAEKNQTSPTTGQNIFVKTWNGIVLNLTMSSSIYPADWITLLSLLLIIYICIATFIALPARFAIPLCLGLLAMLVGYFIYLVPFDRDDTLYNIAKWVVLILSIVLAICVLVGTIIMLTEDGFTSDSIGVSFVMIVFVVLIFMPMYFKHWGWQNARPLDSTVRLTTWGLSLGLLLVYGGMISGIREDASIDERSEPPIFIPIVLGGLATMVGLVFNLV